jgi:proteasome lid subunit RPN8/RPN11
MWEKKQRKTPQKICRLFMGWEQVMKTKPCKVYDDDDDDDGDDIL